MILLTKRSTKHFLQAQKYCAAEVETVFPDMFVGFIGNRLQLLTFNYALKQCFSSSESSLTWEDLYPRTGT